MKIQGKAEYIFQRTSRCSEIGGSPPYECLNVLLKQSSILRENQVESWPNLCNFFLRFPNVLHGVDFRLLRDGNEWNDRECLECMTSHLNISN